MWISGEVMAEQEVFAEAANIRMYIILHIVF